MPALRFLFVDDDAPLLSAMERNSRRYRSDVATVFVCGGSAGIATLSEGSFDAVISDMRMPRIDGTVVLAAARESQPAALRVILSGQADHASTMRSARSAHQFMSKPTGPDIYPELIRRVTSLHRRVPDPAQRTRIGGIGQFPILPRIQGELAVALAQPDAPTRQLARIIIGDAGLCAKVLQLANSGFLGLARPFLTIDDALASLGAELLGTIVAGMPIETDPFAEEIQREAGDHARAAAASVGPALAGPTYTAALLGSLGRRMLGRFADEGQARAAAAYLLEAWGLPGAIVEAVAAPAFAGEMAAC
jgi:DNA-binding NarL/FixJ family response regulator